MLVEQGVAPGWMVALIVVREFLVTALRLAALERGVVLHARDLGKLKTWSQALAAAIGGFAAAGAWRDDFAYWAVLVALVLTWISGLDYARVAPRLWRGSAPRLSPVPRRATGDGAAVSASSSARGCEGSPCAPRRLAQG
jgi:phosphatidylglycerophosphate synthase